MPASRRNRPLLSQEPGRVRPSGYVSDQGRTECIAELLAVEDLAQNLAAALAPQLAAQARDGQPRVKRVVPRRGGNGFTAPDSTTHEE